MSNYKFVYLNEIAEVKRATKGKIYKAGTIYIGLSATSGEVCYLERDGEIPTKYAAVEVDEEYNSFYIYNSILQFFPDFFAKWVTGMNLQFSALAHLEIGIHDRKTQDEYAEMLKEADWLVYEHEHKVEYFKDMKKFYLAKLFP